MSSSETLLFSPSTPSRSGQNTPIGPSMPVKPKQLQLYGEGDGSNHSEKTQEALKESEGKDEIASQDHHNTPHAGDHKGYTISFPAQAADRLLLFTDAQEAEEILTTLVSDTRSGRVDPSWITSLGFCPPLLRGLFRLGEAVTAPNAVLTRGSPCARVIDLLLERFPVQDILSIVCNQESHAAVGMRYIIRKARTDPQRPCQWPYSSMQNGEVSIEAVIHYAFQIINKLGVCSAPSIHAIRLVESVLPGIHTLEELQGKLIRDVICEANGFLERNNQASDGPPEVSLACSTATLQLLASALRTYKSLSERLETESGVPVAPGDGWLGQDIPISCIFNYMQDDHGDPFVRCMALQVLRSFADVVPEAVSDWCKLPELMDLCSEVILWRTEWQHGLESKAKLLGVVKFCPHDDAYRIMSFAPPAFIISSLLKALATGENIGSLEPLFSMIVHHSTLKDHYWPFMLSMLIRGGCFNFFLDILRVPVENEEHPHYRTTCRAKANACVGLTRCFEQMRAKDTEAIPPDTGTILEWVAKDPGLPLDLCERASAALSALMTIYNEPGKATCKCSTGLDEAPKGVASSNLSWRLSTPPFAPSSPLFFNVSPHSPKQLYQKITGFGLKFSYISFVIHTFRHSGPANSYEDDVL
ncbi:hypothetical protein FS837_007545 [Tulasnella sp. UAMH 9824]|nr:hypothetical protein FS837_007545 [Tulasnella sp. UAMH 9824]